MSILQRIHRALVWDGIRQYDQVVGTEKYTFVIHESGFIGWRREYLGTCSR
jgi:hypothetical protein